ncbi:glycoside hydrolase family 3 C-terminal domain-containing protein [Balneolaceae bacterium ANBcel3]|nr:glycoside hydrolase family 3 C-terminal domain-containing protein [Balneolaceae bacterium ANBcel3]
MTNIYKVLWPIVFVFLLKTDACAQTYPFQNPELSFEERVEDLISRLTLEEKAALLCDQSDAIPRLGIGKFNWWSEALHGYANNDSVTVFPQPIGMAASFNDELVYEIFSATSDEGRAKYHESQRRGEENRRFLSLSVWTPNVNIFRDPRWGRGQETYGEDPYLMTRMGVQVVKGLQGPEEEKYRKLLAAAKHFAVHSGPEWSRHELNVTNVSPRLLYETYLPAFKALVQDAHVRQVMCAYQKLEDEPCCSNDRLLNRILREDWGFEHLVVADCGAITNLYATHEVSSSRMHAAARGIMGGTDLECVWDNYEFKRLPEAVKMDLVRESDIDQSLRRVLMGRFELGEFDDDELVPWAHIPMSVVNNDEHRELALEMSRQSMTLLHNVNNTLPLSIDIEKVAVIGPNADDAEMLWGNYNGIPIRTITILDGIKSILGEDRVYYTKATDLVYDKVTISYFGDSSIDGRQGFKATYWNNPDFEGEEVITQYLSNPIRLTAAGQHEFAPGVRLEDFSAIYRSVFVPEVSEEIVFHFGATGHFELLVNGESLEKYDNWRTLPSRIAFDVEAGKEYEIEIRYAQLENWEANIQFNFGREEDLDYTSLVEELKDYETVIFVGGISGQLEGEEMPVSFDGFKGGDRTDIELPAVQRNAIKALHEAGKSIILVNNSGSAMAFEPEVERTDAILQAWYGGESGGQAVAEVLFGIYNPSGKLPVTFYRNSDNLGDIEDYTMEGRTYRYTDDHLFPFGFGLSYTVFDIQPASISKTTFSAEETVELTIPVKNAGDRDGTEIVQVYTRKVGDVDGPRRTLKGYQRLEVPKGETREAVIELPPESFEFYDWEQQKMTVTPGEYVVYYGNSSDDKDLQQLTVVIK